MTASQMIFAERFPRNEKGWIKFPSDTDYRRGMFPKEVNQHPAKANVFLVQSIIEYVSKEEDTIMDIMAGTGTIMLGALIYRNVICVEINEKFMQLQLQAQQRIAEIDETAAARISMFNLPCQRFLPVPDLADHIIFSPQYAGILKTKGTDAWNRDLGYDFEAYSSHPLNLGTMSEFLWAMEMATVYQKCFESLKSPGSMTLIIKDHIRAGERMGLTQRAIDSSVEVGFSYDPAEHFKWAAPGMAYTAARRAKGIEVVDDEDIVVLRKA